MDVTEKFQKRVDRTQRFLREKKPGSVLWLRKSVFDIGFEGHWVQRLMKQDVSELLDPKLISDWNEIYLKRIREKYQLLYEMDDDGVPTPEVYFAIGSITSMMCGVPAQFASDTVWCEPNIDDWNVLESLTFDPDNVWTRFYTMVIQDMINHWEGDFCLLPYIHRSPLDAANGLRGNDLFLDCYDEPERVLNLAMKCADWSIACERHIKEVTNWPKDLPRGAWGMALPDDCVFVNGDPVDLVNEEHQAMFDRPSAGKLFTQTGGGFFHHHALGIRQVGNVAKTKGLVVQNVYTDPGIEEPLLQIIQDEKIAQMFIEASLKAPIYISGDFVKHMDAFMPILEQGCFILADGNTKGYETCARKLEKLRV